jgi:signal transduction histidine kinase
MSDEPEIPWARVAAFVRQHTHDVRNGLNGLELETALLQELVPDGEAHATVRRLRKQVRSIAEQLRVMSSAFQEPQPHAGPIAAHELLLIWREKHAALPGAPQVRWEDALGAEQVSVDAEMLATVFSELLRNAAAFSPGTEVSITARANDDAVIFELREPKQEAVDTSAWGQPFTTTRRDGYGLGLWAARRLIEANGGSMVQRCDGDALTTQVVLPVVESAGASRLVATGGL